MSIEFDREGPGFDDPLAMLYACHERVRHFAQLGVKLSAHLAAHGNDAMAREAASNILRYFSVAAPLHHQDEEEDLFPALLSVSPDDIKTDIRRIAAEHADLTLLWEQMRAALELIMTGTAVLDDDLARQFSERYRNHADEEERLIYPYARRFLDQPLLQEMGARMAARREC